MKMKSVNSGSSGVAFAKYPRLLENRRYATMKTHFTHCLTLRITPAMDSLIADAAYDARMMSKAAWIRLAIARSLRQKQQRQDAVQWQENSL